MKDGVMIINTSRGGLIDTPELVTALKSKKVGAVGLDVFEGEGDYFYEDRSGAIIADDALARIFTFPNVIITGHQAYFTAEALDNIAHTTMENIQAYVSKSAFKNEVNSNNNNNQASARSSKHPAMNNNTTDAATMKIAFFSAHAYDIESMKAIAKQDGIAADHELLFFPNRLSAHTAQLAAGCEGVVIFVNDTADEAALRKLHANGTRALFLRCAGFDMVDLAVAKELDIPVLRVPAYS
ncbi:hypothetical protein PybrP1_010691, partial [[Pythium] brassicae (nom. inval.)]